MENTSLAGCDGCRLFGVLFQDAAELLARAVQARADRAAFAVADLGDLVGRVAFDVMQMHGESSRLGELFHRLPHGATDEVGDGVRFGIGRGIGVGEGAGAVAPIDMRGGCLAPLIFGGEDGEAGFSCGSAQQMGDWCCAIVFTSSHPNMRKAGGLFPEWQDAARKVRRPARRGVRGLALRWVGRGAFRVPYRAEFATPRTFRAGCSASRVLRVAFAVCCVCFACCFCRAHAASHLARRMFHVKHSLLWFDAFWRR